MLCTRKFSFFFQPGHSPGQIRVPGGWCGQVQRASGAGEEENVGGRLQGQVRHRPARRSAPPHHNHRLHQEVVKLYQVHVPPMDALIFPGRLRPGKRSASIGRRLFIYLVRYTYLASSNGCTSFSRPSKAWEKKCFHWQKALY